jgi:hypothetical protein
MTLDDSRAHDARTPQALTFKIAIDAPLKIDHGGRAFQLRKTH